MTANLSEKFVLFVQFVVQIIRVIRSIRGASPELFNLLYDVVNQSVFEVVEVV